MICWFALASTGFLVANCRSHLFSEGYRSDPTLLRHRVAISSPRKTSPSGAGCAASRTIRVGDLFLPCELDLERSIETCFLLDRFAETIGRQPVVLFKNFRSSLESSPVGPFFDCQLIAFTPHFIHRVWTVITTSFFNGIFSGYFKRSIKFSNVLTETVTLHSSKTSRAQHISDSVVIKLDLPFRVPGRAPLSPLSFPASAISTGRRTSVCLSPPGNRA